MSDSRIGRKLPQPSAGATWSWDPYDGPYQMAIEIEGHRWGGHHVAYEVVDEINWYAAPNPDCELCDPPTLVPLVTQRGEDSLAMRIDHWARGRERDKAVAGLIDIAVGLEPPPLL